MARTWKFVGSSNMPRNSLQAAVKAVLDGEAEGAKAIFDAETGDLYDLLGNPYPPITANQYQSILNVLGVIFVHVYHELPMSKDGLLPLLAQIGDPVFSGVKKTAADYAVALVQMNKAGEETKDASVTDDSGPIGG